MPSGDRRSIDPVMSHLHDPSAELHVAASGSAAQQACEERDVLSDVLRSVRLTGSMYFLVEASTPWATRAPAASAFAAAVLPRAQHLISYHVITAGSCWGGLEGHAPQRLEAGDILVVPHGAPYFLAAPPETRTGYDDDEAVSFFRRMAAGELSAVVEEGGGGPDRTSFICGFLGCDKKPFNPLLAALPEVIYLRRGARADDRMHHLIAFALCELRAPSAGRQETLLRLSELMFIETVRRYLETLPEPHAGWLVDCAIRWWRGRCRCCMASRPAPGVSICWRPRPAPRVPYSPSALPGTSSSRRCST